MKPLFYIFLSALLVLELLVLRFQNSLNYKKSLAESNSVDVTLIKDPASSGFYQILDFGYFKATFNSADKFRVGDILRVKSFSTCNKDNICNLYYKKAYSIDKIGEKWYAGIVRLFLDIREKVNNLYLRNLSSPYAELLAGMTLGIKELPDKFNQDLIKTGVIHVVVVSGFNVSLVISALFPLLIFLGRRCSFFISILGVLFFVFLVGFEPPILRAAVMGLILLYGKYEGRERSVLAALLVTAVLMVFISPLIVLDLSFILSFLATFGLIVFSPVVKKYVSFKLYGLEEDFVSTLSAQVLVWPIISYYFGRVSMLGPLVNILVLWVVPLATVLGFLYIIFAFIFEILGLEILLFLFTAVIKIPLIYFSQVVTFFSRLPFSQIEVQIGIGFMAFYYLFICFFLLWMIKRKSLVLQ